MRRWAPEAALVAVLLVAEGLLFARNLDTASNYDEGVYLASLSALEDGETLGSEVFASQPPGFYALLRIVGWLTPHSVHSARIGFLLVALLGCAAAYALGRALAGVEGGILASCLLAIMPPFPSEAMRVDADVPSVSLSLVALALAAHAFEGRPGNARNRLLLSGSAGAALALAISVKLLALAAVVPFAALALRAARRRGTRTLRQPVATSLLAAAGGAAAVAVVFLIAYAGVLGDLWTSVVGFHDEARAFPSPVPNGDVLREFLQLGTPSAWLAILGTGAALVAWRQVWPLWTWTVAAVAFLLVQKPLFDHHLVLLCGAVAVPAGVALAAVFRRLPLRATPVAFVVLLLALAAGDAQQTRRIDSAVTSEPGELLWGTVKLIACTKPGAVVGSDQPIAAFRARRRLPGQLVDTSKVRLSTSSLRPAEVLAIVDREHLPAVFAGRSFLDYPEILAGLERRFGKPARLGEARFYGCAQSS